MISEMALRNMCFNSCLVLFAFVQVVISQSEDESAGPSNRLAHNPFLRPEQTAEPQSVFPYPIVDGIIIFPDFASRYTEQNPHWELYENRPLGTPNVVNNLGDKTPEALPGDQPNPVPNDRPATRIPHYPTTLSAIPTHQPTTTTTTSRATTRAPRPTTGAPVTPEETYELVTCPTVSEAFDRSTKKCYHLATRGPCTKDSWWILNKNTHLPECRPRPCPAFFSKSPVTQECILIHEAEKESVCGVRENLVNNVYGDPECRCAEHNYRMTDGLCYPTYQRGPCMPAHFVIYNEETRTAKCEINVCNMDNFVWVDGRCYELGAICGEHGEKNIYINPHDGVIGCYDFFRLPISQTQV